MATYTDYGPVLGPDGWEPRSYVQLDVTETTTKYTIKVKFGIQPSNMAIPAGWTVKGKLTGNVEHKTYSKTTTAIAKNALFQVGTVTVEKEKRAGSTYTFSVDWYADIVGYGTCDSANYTFTIQKLPTYTVTFKKDNTASAATLTTQTKTHGTALTLTTSKPTKTNYNFASWNINTSGTGTNYASGGSYTANAAVTLYPRWTPVTYAVKYNANGGSGAPAQQTKTYGTTLKLSSTIPTRSGYTFVKWNTNSSGTGTNYASGANYTANAAVTLYAVWQINYTPPQITKLTGYRTDTDGNKDDEGTSFKVDFTWDPGTDSSGSVTLSSAIIKWKKTTESSYPSANSFSVNITSTNVSIGVGITAALDTDAQYDVQVTLTPSNNHPNIIRTTYISTSSFIIDINAAGNAVGIGMAAPDGVSENQLWIDANMYLKKDLLLEKTDPRLRVRTFDANNAVVADGHLSASTSGNFGLYDQKHNKWLIRSDTNGQSHFAPIAITTLYNTKTTASSTQNTWVYTSAISNLANYNIVALRAEVYNIRQILFFLRPLGDAAQMVMDMSGTTYIRAQFIVDWMNNKVGVRWVNGTSDLSSGIYFQQVYGIM